MTYWYVAFIIFEYLSPILVEIFYFNFKSSLCKVLYSYWLMYLIYRIYTLDGYVFYTVLIPVPHRSVDQYVHNECLFYFYEPPPIF